jgi:hypothetical protein
MAADQTKFVERVAKGVERLLDQFGPHKMTLNSTKELEDSIRAMVAEAANAAVNRRITNVSSFVDGVISGLFQDTLTRYRNAHAVMGKVNNLRRQEDWADSVDRLKLLLYRVATTMCIAAVVLGTSYLAHRWGIPLPLLRLAP